MADFILDIKILDEIVKRTTDSIDGARQELYDITENMRKEVTRLKESFDQLVVEAQKLNQEVGDTEKELAKSKSRLLVVSKNYNMYSEEQIKEAYENADKLRVHMVVIREKEKDTILRRNETEIRLKQSKNILKRAENLVSQVGIAMNYLTGNLQDLSVQLEDIRSRQVFALKILKAQEEERRRVARDIHDGPAQIMSNVILKSELCDKLINIDVDQAKNELKDLKNIVRDSLRDIRRIIYDLRPMALDDLGLIPTIERYATGFGRENGMNVEFSSRGDLLHGLNNMLSLTIFRIIQESLNNIKKHAEADNVLIIFIVENDKISIKIQDDGIGFDTTEKSNSDSESSGFGLTSMRERVKLLDGSFSLQSQKGKGTRIIINLPIIKENIGEIEK